MYIIGVPPCESVGTRDPARFLCWAITTPPDRPEVAWPSRQGNSRRSALTRPCSTLALWPSSVAYELDDDLAVPDRMVPVPTKATHESTDLYPRWPYRGA